MKYIESFFRAIKTAYKYVAEDARHTYRYLRLQHKRRLHKRRVKRRTVPYTHCKNCGQELRGMYCHACGQYAREINPNIGAFVWQYFENAFQFDGRAWVTLRHLFSYPGRLSLEFMAGHIRRYVFPLKLYMAVAVIFGFVILAVQNVRLTTSLGEKSAVTQTQDSLIHSELTNGHTLDTAQLKRLEELLLPKGDGTKEMVNSITSSSVNYVSRLPIIMMFAMPMFALFSMLFFRRRYKKYLPHLIFAIHVHTQFFITIMLMLILETYFYSTFVGYVLWAMFFWMVVYGYIAAKRFFGEGWVRVFFKNAGLYFIYFIFCLVVFVAGFIVNLGYDSWASGSGFMTTLQEFIS